MYPTDSIDDLNQKHREFVVAMGWDNKKTPLECVALIASEIGELANELRHEDIDKKKTANELADIILRTMDLATELDISAGRAVFDKICHNLENIEKHKAKGRVK